MIQWYPGHMAKAKREMSEKLKKVDLVIETLDARIPESSRNPDLKALLDNQDHLIVLNKIDLAVPEITEKWEQYLSQEATVVKVNSIKKKGIGKLLNILNNKASNSKKYKQSLKVMVSGVTNVGKSALINALVGVGKAKTGRKPGVTRGQQWIKVSQQIYLLDTPGILWPKFEDKEVSYKLALTGAINKDVFDVELAAYKLIEYVMGISPEKIENQYCIEINIDEPYEVLELIGKKRGCLMSGGKIDRNRTSNIVINDFQKGKFERISLEKPADNE